jgi:hypothetical protein
MTVKWGKGDRHATLEVARYVNEHVERWIYHVAAPRSLTELLCMPVQYSMAVEVLYDSVRHNWGWSDL